MALGTCRIVGTVLRGGSPVSGTYTLTAGLVGKNKDKTLDQAKPSSDLLVPTDKSGSFTAGSLDFNADRTGPSGTWPIRPVEYTLTVTSGGLSVSMPVAVGPEDRTLDLSTVQIVVDTATPNLSRLEDVNPANSRVGRVLSVSQVDGSTASSFVAAYGPDFQPIDRIPVTPPTQIISAFQSGHGFTVTQDGTAGDNLNDTTDYALGSQSVKLVTGGTGVAHRLDRVSGLSFDTTGKNVVLWVKVDDLTHFQAFEVWLGIGGFGTYWRLSCYNSVSPNLAAEHLRAGEWTRLVIPWSAATLVQANGSPTRTGITALRVMVLDDNTGNPVTARIGGIGLQPAVSTAYPNGVVSLTFDDSYGNQFTAARPTMDAYGFGGTAYTIASQVAAGSPNLTLSQLKTMQDISGWEIAGHAYSLANHNADGGFPALGSDVVDADFANLRTWMLDNGFRSSQYAYPQGYHSASVEATMKKYFGTGRTISTRCLESLPPSQAGRIRVRVVTSATSTATVQGWIDDAYTYGAWLVLVFHSIDDTALAGSNSYTTANFATVVAYLNTKTIPVRTVEEVLRRA